MNSRAAAIRAWASLCAALLLAAGGCGGEPPASDSPGASAAARASSPVRGVQLRFTAGRVSLASEQAFQLAILEDLAARAGFELVVGPLAPRNVTLRFEDAPLLDAISALLEGVPFRAEYRVDATTGAHVLARLVVGEPAAVARLPAGKQLQARLEAAAGKPVDELRGDLRRRLGERRTALSPERIESARAFSERQRAQQAESLEQLSSGDAARRADALAALDPDGEALSQIAELARSDPDPGVRAAAVSRLGDGDTFRAQSALLDSLADPSPQVLIAALKALESAGDESMLGQIEPFAAHPDPGVREAASETIETLQ
jgi:hypothetical protein